MVKPYDHLKSCRKRFWQNSTFMYDKNTKNEIKLSTFITFIQHSFGIHSHCYERRKRSKKNPNWKIRKTVIAWRWHDTIHKKSEGCHQKITRTHQWICWSCRIYTIDTSKSVAFVYTDNERSGREIKETTSFTMSSKRIKYLGVNLPKEANLYDEQNQWHGYMETFTMFLDWNNRYYQSDYNNQGKLQIQCNPY